MENEILFYVSVYTITSVVVVVVVVGGGGGSVRGVMVIVVGNGHGDTSSNPGPDWLHFT